MKKSINQTPVRSLILALCLALSSVSMASANEDILIGEKVGIGVQYDLNNNECPPNMEQVYEDVVQEAAAAVSAGHADAALLDYLITNKDALIDDCDLLADAVMVVDIEEQRPFLPFKAGIGTTDGTYHVGRSLLGFVVATVQIQVSWQSSACQTRITGATWTGGVFLGTCTVKQLGPPATKDCGRTERCLIRTTECATYQANCKQVIAFSRFGTTNWPADTICADCP